MTGAALAELERGGKAALGQALSRIESEPDADDVVVLLDAALDRPRGRVIGLTGPPGVGKSTLAGSLVRRLREGGATVGVIAVDPSSRLSGGALLGDRARIATDASDDGVFVRSMAARDRLGGLAASTAAAVVLMRALFDRVLVETVGVGQSEADVAHSADTVVLCVQPASGDALQFMKAGIMEIPDLVVVTKADLGAPASRALAEVEGAIGLAAAHQAWQPRTLSLSARDGCGLKQLLAALDEHWRHLAEGNRFANQRRRQMTYWIRERVRVEFGASGLRKLDAEDGFSGADASFSVARTYLSRLALG